MGNDKYQTLFFEESDEYLYILNDRILLLEENPEDNTIIDEIFRAAHTLKGMAATMGYEDMAKLTHNMENVFELFRSNKIKVTTDIISLIFKCLDRLSEIVEDLREGNDGKIDVSDLIKDLKQVGNEDNSSIESKNTLNLKEEELSSSDYLVIEEAEKKGLKAYDILIEVSEDCTLKGPRAFLVVTKLKEVGELLATFPSVQDLEEGEYDNNFRLICLSEENIEKIQEVVENNAEIESVSIKKIESSGGKKDNSAKNKIENRDTKKSKSVVKTNNQSIRVNLDKLDNFMNLVSELVIYRTRLEDIATRIDSDEMSEPLAQVSKITSDLQSLVLSIRMEAVNVVFNRFPRMIRDLSQELNKDMNLVIEGENTELDRTVVSELGEPLVHLIRNAADHGIETRDERVKKGKPETGTINLRAFQEGNRVVIQVSDDGSGIDPEVIRKSAEKKSIETEGLSDQELIELIFDKGFSTNTNVTNLSGRGVGMDVVRSKINSLGGTIELSSTVDKGSTFTIKLPLSLLIIQALLIKVGGEIFAISLEIIERVIQVEEEHIKSSHSGEIYVLEEETIPIIRLTERFNLESETRNQHLILVIIDNKRYGILVDDFLGQQDIVIKKLGKSLKNMKDFIGATILGSGDIILIVDIINIINSIKDDENNG